ncbi:hypothetical protein BaRGS_00016473 [Batillaria attramentaria]|uniref:Uncharacterized protein n=1 Tax=Batillaria attramentaria TaxID=370345 RepID=A0ABD0KZ39_9CAEN
MQSGGVSHSGELSAQSGFVEDAAAGRGSKSAQPKSVTWDHPSRRFKFVVTFDTTDPKGRCSDSARSLTVYTTLVVAQAVDVDELEQMLLSLRNTSISVPVASNWVNLTTQPDDSVPERLQKPGKKAAGGSCAVTYSQESNALDGDEDLVFTEVNDLLLMPQVALQQDEFVFVKATDGLRVAWLEEEISSQR